jgi:hypothetical protein
MSRRKNYPDRSRHIFFLIQAIGLGYTRVTVGAACLLKRPLEDCWRILLTNLPLVLLTLSIVYLFGKVDQAFFIESGPRSNTMS